MRIGKLARASERLSGAFGREEGRANFCRGEVAARADPVAAAAITFPVQAGG